MADDVFISYLGQGGGGASCFGYFVRKGEPELEKYGTLALASKSVYRTQFKELAKMAELKHKERKMLRKFRLFQPNSLSENKRTLTDGRTWSQILSNAESGNVADMLKLAESYATGVLDGKIPKRPKESLGWYLRAAVCASAEGMKVSAQTLATAEFGHADPSLVVYWEERAHQASASQNCLQ